MIFQQIYKILKVFKIIKFILTNILIYLCLFKFRILDIKIRSDSKLSLVGFIYVVSSR